MPRKVRAFSPSLLSLPPPPPLLLLRLLRLSAAPPPGLSQTTVRQGWGLPRGARDRTSKPNGLGGRELPTRLRKGKEPTRGGGWAAVGRCKKKKGREKEWWCWWLKPRRGQGAGIPSARKRGEFAACCGPVFSAVLVLLSPSLPPPPPPPPPSSTCPPLPRSQWRDIPTRSFHAERGHASHLICCWPASQPTNHLPCWINENGKAREGEGGRGRSAVVAAPPSSFPSVLRPQIGACGRFRLAIFLRCPPPPQDEKKKARLRSRVSSSDVPEIRFWGRGGSRCACA